MFKDSLNNCNKGFMRFDHLEYKKRNMIIWNEIASRYHKRWASINDGPFQSTEKLIQFVNINDGDKVLDLACGTGIVTKIISEKIGKLGCVIGIDVSSTAIKIAKKLNGKRTNLDFINMDAEKFYFCSNFDVVTCQYALFFFPDAQRALRNIKNSLKDGGRLGISVHGKKVPFFSNILDAVSRFIPDYIPSNSPDLDRFGTEKSLKKEIKEAGFSNILVREFVFKYSPGKFDDYWNNYLRYIAKPLKDKLNSLEIASKRELRDTVKENTKPYTKKDGNIEFPWQVLVLTAKK